MGGKADFPQCGNCPQRNHERITAFETFGHFQRSPHQGSRFLQRTLARPSVTREQFSHNGILRIHKLASQNRKDAVLVLEVAVEGRRCKTGAVDNRVRVERLKPIFGDDLLCRPKQTAISLLRPLLRGFHKRRGIDG